jgi:serine protease inhibitor
MITFDHPFLFIIQDNESGAILFIGQVINPNGEPESG